jgi:hypothetical protein
MNPILRNVFAVLLGWFGGSVVNMGLVQLGHALLPIPDIDPNDMEALAAAMPTLDAAYFIFPFLAHALGTMVGAGIALFIAATHKTKFALSIGGLFLIGGITVSFMLPAPAWFIVIDLLVAYLPMAWLGAKIAGRLLIKSRG